MFKVHLDLSHKKASSLHKDQLPAEHLTIYSDEIDSKKSDTLKTVISKFNKHGDNILHEVFSAFLKNKKLTFQVFYTFGIPAPYDAWTVSRDGKKMTYY